MNVPVLHDGPHYLVPLVNGGVRCVEITFRVPADGMSTAYAELVCDAIREAIEKVDADQ
jgi:2-keto-3-deoxy-6-phosphogluconate aldolase